MRFVKTCQDAYLRQTIWMLARDARGGGVTENFPESQMDMHMGGEIGCKYAQEDSNRT